jgi:putative lipase involved disintegration of autophagic bodies
VPKVVSSLHHQRIYSSTQTLLGYALEARCHLGKVIVYDTITKFGWSLRLKHHPIAVMIGQILSENWESELGGRQVPEPVAQSDCIVSIYTMLVVIGLIFMIQDCFKWDFLDD